MQCNPSGSRCHRDSHCSPATICATAALCQPGEQPYCAFTQLKIGLLFLNHSGPAQRALGMQRFQGFPLPVGAVLENNGQARSQAVDPVIGH